MIDVIEGSENERLVIPHDDGEAEQQDERMAA